MDAGNLQGIIPLLGGVFLLFILWKKLPEDPEKAEAAQNWREKFGTGVTVLAALNIVFGLATLSGVLN